VVEFHKGFVLECVHIEADELAGLRSPDKDPDYQNKNIK